MYKRQAQLIGYETKALSVSALSGDDSDDDPLTWLLLDQHALTPEQAVYRQVCTEELERLFRTLSAKDCAIPVSYTHLDVYKRQADS